MKIFSFKVPEELFEKPPTPPAHTHTHTHPSDFKERKRCKQIVADKWLSKVRHERKEGQEETQLL